MNNKPLSDIKIFNINAKTEDGIDLQLQMVEYQKLHNQICLYLERKLIDVEHMTNIKTLQNTLNDKAYTQEEFKKFNFCADQRVYELMVDESVCGTMQLGCINRVKIRFLWQSKNQPGQIQKFTNTTSGSIDGMVGIFPTGEKRIATLPIEAKSTMLPPSKNITETLDQQALELIQKKKDDLSAQHQVSALLILPNTVDQSLSIDLQPIANELQSTIAKDSLAAISLLSLHENGICLTTCMLYGKNFQLDVKKANKFIAKDRFIFPKHSNSKNQ